MLDIVLFRTNPEIIRESQRKRFKPVELVDQVIELDNEWRSMRGRLDTFNMYVKMVSKGVGTKIAAMKKEKKNPEEVAASEVQEVSEELIAKMKAFDMKAADLETLNVSQLKNFSKIISAASKDYETLIDKKETERNSTIKKIGNILHPSVPISNNEDDNGIVRTFGEATSRPGLKNHIDLMLAINGMDTQRGTKVAGGRGYYLMGDLVRLQQGIIHYAVSFLSKRGYCPVYTPFFMRQDMMGKVAQLDDFDDQLYKVSGEGEDKYLIATSEQTIAAFHCGEWIDPKSLPLKYAGFSTCFRKEVGSHGRDTLGIFRVHQFEKIEQYVLTSPAEGESWKMMDEMIKNAEDFYQSLNIPYRVVSIVSGALNNAAAMKFDLEGWYPASQTYRELVSCSNCTDYQPRGMDTRLMSVKKDSDVKEYVHGLNSTLCALTRTMCVICENNQTETGITIPEVLRPYCDGLDFIPFRQAPTPAADGAAQK